MAPWLTGSWNKENSSFQLQQWPSLSLWPSDQWQLRTQRVVGRANRLSQFVWIKIPWNQKEANSLWEELKEWWQYTLPSQIWPFRSKESEFFSPELTVILSFGQKKRKTAELSPPPRDGEKVNTINLPKKQASERQRKKYLKRNVAKSIH